MSRCNKIFFVVFLGFCTLAGGVHRVEGVPHPVQVRLLADVEAVVPGQAFHLGVELRMEEGWHTYWQFSGDTGAPTKVEWELPAGFSTGPLMWPLPSKYTEGDDLVVEQVTKHLHKLIDVIKVSDISDQNIVSRELALIRVHANPQIRSEIMQVVDIFRANIVDVATDSIIVEVSGDEEKVDSLHELLKPFGVVEVMRTGTIALNRGMGSEGTPRRSTNGPRAGRKWGEASSV